MWRGLCVVWARFRAILGDISKEPEGKCFKQLEGIMHGSFLAPSSWPKLRSRPFALFGSAFSHIDKGHISGNLVALRMCHEAETWLGTKAFAHLYLTSALLSGIFCCLWHEHTPARLTNSADRESLGASGAISGVMAWWCIECFKRGHELEFNGRRVSPIFMWLLYVAIDASGLLRLPAVQTFFQGMLSELLGEKRDKKDKKDSKESEEVNEKAGGEIGYDAHIGGALAGLLWQSPWVSEVIQARLQRSLRQATRAFQRATQSNTPRRRRHGRR